MKLKSYAEIKQQVDKLINKMSMFQLEILLEQLKHIKIEGEDKDDDNY